jgi:hypothetical protein
MQYELGDKEPEATTTRFASFQMMKSQNMDFNIWIFRKFAELLPIRRNNTVVGDEQHSPHPARLVTDSMVCSTITRTISTFMSVQRTR